MFFDSGKAVLSPQAKTDLCTAASGAEAALSIDRRDADSLSMSYHNTPGAARTLLRLVPETGRMQSAQLAKDGPELAEFTCKEAI